MRHLFYFYSCFNGPFFGELLDEAIELKKDNSNEILFVYCGGVCEMCTQNSKGSKPLCRFCTNNTKRVLDCYNIKNDSLSSHVGSSTNVSFQYNRAAELREITYRKVRIGMSILSSYITRTRNLDPLIDENSRKYFDAHLKQCVRLVDSLYAVVDSFIPDAIHSFNGRFEEVRPIYDICMDRGIKCYLNEGTGVNGHFKRVVFEDRLPHDIKYYGERREFAWNHYPMTEEEKIELGKSFFEHRRNGIAAGDKVYIKNQVAGNIPPIDKSKINIAIFNSSEDEFAAVGGDWDLLKVFDNQYEGIVYILEHADPNMHFYLRIHPNLKGIPYKYYTDLLKLGSRFSNITVIPPESSVSSYSLLDYMDKVVCFNSTMGIESVYWKKPSIILSAAIYYYDDLNYIPKDKEDLINLLRQPLEPKFNDNIYKFGAFLLDGSPLVIENKNIEYESHNVKFFGFSYPVIGYLRHIISTKVTAFILGAGRYIMSLKPFSRFDIPVKER